MTQEEIKKEVERFRNIIYGAKFSLERLQNECEHPNTFKGNYSWRVGSVMPAKICSDCGKLIEYL